METSAGVARRLAVWKQCFSSIQNPKKSRILETIRKLGCIQIDTINVVERSHYVVLWSRIGNYDKRDLDRLLCPDRKVFEFWAHAASIIPVEHYRYFIHAMKEYRKGLEARATKRLSEKGRLLEKVLDEIRKNGPMTSRDFEQEDKVRRKRRGWWDWKPAKIALEMLFNAGILTVVYRENFQRYYDLTENVLPSGADVTEPTEDERRRFFIEKTFDAVGIAQPSDISSHYYQWCTRTPLRSKEVAETIGQLVGDGILEKVTVKGLRDPCYVLSKDHDAVVKIANDDFDFFDGVTFLSPFDNLTWSKGRTRALFNFSPKLEAYLPERNRKFGYYSMNILYGDRLVGRLDPMVHRDQKVLEMKSLHFEKNFKLTVRFKEKIAEAITSFMQFNEAKTVRFGEMVPRNARIQLSKMIRSIANHS